MIRSVVATRRLTWTTCLLTAVLAMGAGARPAAARFADSDVLLKLRHGRRFVESPPGLARTGSASLDQRLARAGASRAEPLFPPAGADRALHAALELDRFYRVRLDRLVDVPALAAELSRDPDVEWAEPDYEGTVAEAVLPNDPHFDRQWGLRNTGFVPGLGASTPGADIRASEGWSVTTGDSAIVVAVLDSGIRYEYPDLAGRIWVNADEIDGNGIDDDGNGYVDDVRGYNFAYSSPEVRDDLGHGHAVSGVIAATSNDGAGYCGVDWACKIMPVKVLSSTGNGSYSWFASGIYYAANNGARVVNMSLVGLSPSLALQAAVRYAFARDCLVVAAMGNSGQNTRYVPASYDEVLAVGATDRNDRRSGFSTYGNHIDVVAPGQDIAVLMLGNESYTAFGSGTSFASPMAAGLASLLLARNPGLGAAALRDIICATADDGVGHDAQDAPGWDPYYGYGRIDCFRALTYEGIPHAPSVTAPSFLNPVEGTPITIVAAASDPDGDPIQRLDVDLSGLSAGSDVSFVTSADQTSGTLIWTPSFEDEGGPHRVTFRAFEPLRGEATTTMYVVNVNRLPVVAAPATASFVETEAGAFEVQSSDPDGEELVLSAADLPVGATFEDRGDNTGTFGWTPSPGQAGSYTVTFAARDGWNDVTRADTRLDVSRKNRPPAAEAGGPYSGVAGAPIAFDGSGSADPDGDPLRYSWSFGDGGEGVGATAAHAYEDGGDFVAILEVTDGSLSARDSTAARVTDALPARAFLPDGHRSLSLSEGTAPVCIAIEPVGGSYANMDLDLATLALVSEGTGSVTRVTPSLKSLVEADRDRDGVADVSLCFGRSDLRRLFDRIQGRDSVSAAIEGRMAGGAKIHAPVSLVLVRAGGAGAISVSSNPLATGGIIRLRTERGGRLSLRLFDARGRLVRTLAEVSAAASGDHDVPFDGRSARGRKLPSGIYFLVAQTPEGTTSRRIAVLK